MQISFKNSCLKSNCFGFFLKLDRKQSPFYCLMSNEHAIDKKMIESKESIEIYYDNQHKKINIILDKMKRYIRDYRYLGIDATIVEILPEDKIPKDYFLLPNLNYITGYDQFLNKKIFIPQYPGGGNLNNSFGKIIEINSSTFEFSHSASTQKGSSGSPIILDGSCFVLGIHKQGNKNKIKNYGNFIGPIVKSLKGDIPYEKREYDNGIYEGEIIDGIREGYGKFFYNDGHIYIGFWKNDIPNGKGNLYLNKKLIYEGDFINEQFEGEGKLMLKNDEYYIGSFSKGEINGKGEYFHKNGEKSVGQFINGDLYGYGITYYKNGNKKYEGEFIKGIKEGKGTLFYEDEIMNIQGNFQMGISMAKEFYIIQQEKKNMMGNLKKTK